jgi:hypothetical protein
LVARGFQQEHGRD